MFVTGLDPLAGMEHGGLVLSGSHIQGNELFNQASALTIPAPVHWEWTSPSPCVRSHRSDEEWAPLGWGTCLTMLAWDSAAFLLPTLHGLILGVQGTDVDGSLLTFSSLFKRPT